MRTSFLLIALLSVWIVSGQTNNSTLRGSVRDASEGAIPGVEVRAVNRATSQAFTTVSNEVGLYEFPFLPPGGYVLNVQKSGFQKYQQEGITLLAGDVRHLDITMVIGGTTESVTVQADASALQSDTASLSESISPQRMESLPLLGRNFTSLMTVQPGVSAEVVSGSGLSFSMNGGPSGNGFTLSLDGTDATSISTQRVAVARNGFQQTNTTSLEAVQEIRVYTNNYSVDIGRSTSGAMNLVTKSGTNQLHFGLFEYFRNSVLNANGTVANAAGLARAPIRLNQFGANAGGHIVHDRTFFWLGWENSNQRQGQTDTYNVLSETGRAAITDAGVRRYFEDWIPLPNQPPTALNPAIALLIRNDIVAVRESIGTARIDHRVTNKNSVFFRYNILDAVTQIPGLFYPKSAVESNARQSLYTLSDTHTFSPSVVNELRIGANRFLTPQIDGGPVPSLTVAGGILAATGSTTSYVNTAYNAIDSVFVQRGRHGLRAGVEWRQIYSGRWSNAISNFVYNTLANLYNNTPSQLSIVQRYGGSCGTGGSISSFVQDDWKVRSNLTLNLGLRYDLFFVPGERTGRAFNILSGVPPISNLQFNQVGQAVEKRDGGNFGPRFGFAWNLAPKMVLRGGYGIFFAPQQASMGVTLSANGSYPFRSQADTDFAFIQSAVSYTQSDAALLYPVTTYGTTKYPQLAPTIVDPNYKENYAQQWNITIEREFATGTTISAGYVASKNTNVESSRILNLPRPLVNNTRENSLFTNVTYIGPLSASSYQSLQLVFTRRLSRGLTVEANYTWSHSIDDWSAFFGLNATSSPLQNQGNLDADRGESDFDARHQLKSSFLYQLPFHPAQPFMRQIARGWEVSGIMVGRTGLPFSVMTGGSIGDSLNNQRASYVSGQPLHTGSARALNALVLNPAAFVIPTGADPTTGFRVGNMGKSALAGPPSVT